MVNAVSAQSAGAPPPFATPDPVGLAARIIRDNSQNGRANLSEIKRDLDAVKAQDPELAAAVSRNVEARLTPVQRGQLAAATYAARAPDGQALVFASDAPSVADYRAQAPGSAGRALYDRMDRIWGDGRPGTDDTIRIEAGLRTMQASGLSLSAAEATQFASTAPLPASPSRATLTADLVQLALDLAGIVDPTGIADGSNAILSVGRAIGSAIGGEFGEAGGHLGNGVLSAAGILPILGDAAKLGKIGKWAQTVADAVAAVAHNPALRAAFEPSLRAIRDAVGKIPQSALDKLPQGARESLERMKGQLDEFFAKPTLPSFDQMVQRYPALAHARDVVIKAAEAANDNFVKKGWNPPYAAGTQVTEFVTTSASRYVRVHGPDNIARSWMMKAEDIQGLTAAQIKDKFALPDLPTLVSDVAVPAGTQVRVGEVAAQPNWGSGGATQFELLERLPEAAFQNTRGLR